MGVSLERVQFKFASIIGELCCEPVILSQFAVWVDLKMAEYKANGAMSLDCSGDQPKPTWMKGVVITIFRENETNDPRKGIGVIGENDVTRHNTPLQTVSRCQSSSVTSSPDLILIKDEDCDQDELFSQDSQRNSYVSKTIPSRKRYSHEQTFETRKHRRSVSPVYPQTSAISNQNESLLSVLGEGIDQGEEERVTAVVNRLFPPDLSTPCPSHLQQPVSHANQSLSNSVVQSPDSISKTTGLYLHSGSEAPFVRQEQSIAFSETSSLPEDMQTGRWNNTMLYPCTLCNYTTQRLYNLKRHLLTHDLGEKHKCVLCDSSFVDNYKLKTHYTHKHAGHPYAVSLLKSGQLGYPLEHTKEPVRSFVLVSELKTDDNALEAASL